MGLFGKKKSASNRVTVDQDDLRLEGEIETDVPGLTLTMPRSGVKVDLEIVGESFRQETVAAVALAANGGWFDIYLMPENGNPYDKNAVRVMVGNHHVGYVSKQTASKWRKAHASAIERGELLGGQAKCFSREGQNFGVFGYVWMPSPSTKKKKEVSAKEVAIGTLALAHAKLHELEMADDPTSIARVKSLAKQAQKACEPLQQHCLWVSQNSHSEAVVEAWAEVEDRLSDLDSALDEAAYADDPEDIDILGVIGEIYAALEEALEASATDNQETSQ